MEICLSGPSIISARTFGVGCERPADGRLHHDADAIDLRPVVFVDAADEVHVAAEEDQFLREAHIRLHNLADVVLHLGLHLHHI